jgi:sortase A
MRNEGRRFALIERVLLAGGVACLCSCAFLGVRAWIYQSANRQAPTTQVPAPSAPEAAHPEPAVPTSLPIGEPIGQIEVPRLHLSAVVANGDDDGTLRVAIGHLPDTPLPWQDGNSALAGHRDTFFRQLRNIRVNDDMRVVTRYGDFAYQVKRTLIVTPDDLSVLDPTPEPTLTLVTCYPFSYVGHAPKRFIVQAVRTDAAPARE